VRGDGGAVVEGVDWQTAGNDLKNHEENVRCQVATEFNDRCLVVLVVQWQREYYPERRDQNKRA